MNGENVEDGEAVERQLVNEAIAKWEFEERYAEGHYQGYLIEVACNWVGESPFTSTSEEMYLDVIARQNPSGKGHRTEKQYDRLVELNNAFENMVDEYNLEEMEPPWKEEEEEVKEPSFLDKLLCPEI